MGSARTCSGRPTGATAASVLPVASRSEWSRRAHVAVEADEEQVGDGRVTDGVVERQPRVADHRPYTAIRPSKCPR